MRMVRRLLSWVAALASTISSGISMIQVPDSSSDMGMSRTRSDRALSAADKEAGIWVSRLASHSDMYMCTHSFFFRLSMAVWIIRLMTSPLLFRLTHTTFSATARARSRRSSTLWSICRSRATPACSIKRWTSSSSRRACSSRSCLDSWDASAIPWT